MKCPSVHSHHGRLCSVLVFASLLLLSGGNALAQGSVAKDRAALVALYNATGDANWGISTNWTSEESISEWYGVDTDEDGRVTVLYLTHNKLSGEIPPELGDLARLSTLDLGNNELSGTIPAELGNLAQLRRLSLGNNELSGEIPAKLGDLANLEELNLGSNELSGTIPPELGDLANLQHLYLPGNELSGTIPAELGDLANLRWLELGDNDLTGGIPPGLGDLGSLRRLALRGNELSGTIPAELGDLANLQRMVLSRNTLSGTIPAELGDLTNLQQLNLTRNNLSGEIPAELGGSTNLWSLYLGGNDLTGGIPSELGDLANLQRMVLNDNQLTGEIPVELGNLARLSTLDLGNNELSGTIPPELGGLAQLWWLYLGNNTLGGMIPAELGNLAQLRTLDLGNNTLSGKIPAELENLIHLQVFDIHNTGVCVTADYELRTWIATIQDFERPLCQLALDFAHFANGAAIVSDLVFINAGTAPTRPVLYFYDTKGNPIPAGTVVGITGDLEIQEDGGLTVQREMEPLGELTISTHGRGELVSGSVRVVSDGPIGGVLRFDLPGIGVAGVGASLPLRDTLFPARRQEGGISTAAALRNLTESELVVTCRLMKDGGVLEEAEILLAANGQEAQYIEEMFTGTDTSDFLGSVRCTAPPGEATFTGVAVELDEANRILTTLPVVPVRRTGAREAVLDFAHFANGNGITSDLVFVNRHISSGSGRFIRFIVPPIRPALYFYDKEGHLIAPDSVVEITGDLEVREDGSLSIQTEMEPLAELIISTHGRGELVTGSVKVISDAPIGGVLRFDLPGIGVAGVGASQPVSDAIFPARRQAGGISTAAAIHNLGEEAMMVGCQLMKDGGVLEEVEIDLEANGQEAQYIEQMFTNANTSDFVGSVRCTAPSEGERMFTGVAVELDEANRILTTLPVIPVTPVPEMPSRE